MRHLHLGLVDPRTIGFKLDVQVEKHDFVSMLRDAIANDRLVVAVRELAPPVVQYQLLRNTLERYRALAASTRLSPLPPHSRSVHPGESYEGLLAVHQRLVVFGDLPGDTPPPGDSEPYEEPLVEAVRRFQDRHGLEPDGILGAATNAALRVTPASRVRQLELALERLRWLPDLDERRFIALNIPMFQLWAWDTVPPNGAPTLGMRAIVGRAIGTRTPVFADAIRAVIFRPYWNVPRSIVRHELLPIVRRDPGYLERHDMELVRGDGAEATVVIPIEENLDLLAQGKLSLRQRPGPTNALGLVKFDFPNVNNVYMHDTPAAELFSRSRRDFSHGCVRVEDPVTLATWALKDEPEWSRTRVIAAMSAGRSTSVKLSRPIQVILFYVTAAVMPEDGTVRFAADIYGHDTRLEEALANRRGD
jgi:murein L,D-transpeptidase YcbB/YkuD